MRKQGAVVRWDGAKGFGFNGSPQSNAQLFFHARDWRGPAAPAVNQPVDFEEIHVGGKGPRAMDVRPSGGAAAGGSAPAARNALRPPAQHRSAPPQRQPSHRRSPPPRRESSAGPAYALMLLWLGLWVAGAMLGRFGWLWLLAAFALNVLTFYVYWHDKYAAQQGRWRTSESTLHGFGLLGGWPGAWFAHQILRHKSSKAAFRAVYWQTAVLNLAALAAWVLWPWLAFLR